MLEKQLIYIQDMFQNVNVTYEMVIKKLNDIVSEIDQDTYLECRIFSEDKLMFNQEDVLNNMLVDFEWDSPMIKISNDLVWHEQEDEKLINLKNLSNSLLAIYYENTDYCLSIVSKELYFKRKVSEKYQSLLNEISFGDFCFTGVNTDGINKNIIDYLITNKMVFVIEKNNTDDIDIIVLKNTMNFQSENYSIEFSETGRKRFLTNELGVLLTNEFK